MLNFLFDGGIGKVVVMGFTGFYPLPKREVKTTSKAFILLLVIPPSTQAVYSS